MRENLLIARALLRHGFRSRLAETDAVSPSYAGYGYVTLVVVDDEIVAGNGIPSKAPIDGKTVVLVGRAERRCVGVRQATRPTIGVREAELAGDRVIRIAG